MLQPVTPSDPIPTPTEPPPAIRRVRQPLVPLPDAAAIDFGASNTDAAAVVSGRLVEWTLPQNGAPDAVHVRRILAAQGISPAQLSVIGVTGGHHRGLPDAIDGCPIRKIGELAAIARGGQALAAGGPMELPHQPLLVVSAGSGTAMVRAEGTRYLHVTGSGMGGGTLLGLGWLLLKSSDPTEIDRLAAQGSANQADLVLQDIVTGPIGALPPDATAVNFGRIVRLAGPPTREDLAAALVNMV
ncbi:MAG TPA: hypothetical protein VNK95_11605, partial [Caldilineaceae bacterium]|nr:hypothetical protein [Caldilineaceae bacterium]